MTENSGSDGRLVPLCQTEVVVSSEEDMSAASAVSGRKVEDRAPLKLERRATEDKECMTDSVVYVMLIENNNSTIATQAVASIVQNTDPARVATVAPVVSGSLKVANIKLEEKRQNSAPVSSRAKPAVVKDPKTKRKDTMWLMNHSRAQAQFNHPAAKPPSIPTHLSSIFHRDKKSTPSSPTQSESIQFEHLRLDKHIAPSEASTAATPISSDSLATSKFNQIAELKHSNQVVTSVKAVVNLNGQPQAEEAEGPVREQWDRKLEFLLAIIGFSVDLGNIWRFPKIVFDNGGGKFLIPYFVQLALCGLPLFYMELALGQFHQTGLFTLWEKLCPILKGIAFTTMAINIFMAMFYNTVIAWAVYYLILSFNFELPWKRCDKEWNTQCCLPINDAIPVGQNFESYQKIRQDGPIYRLYDQEVKKLTIFNTNLKKDGALPRSTFYDWVFEYYNVSNTSMSLPEETKWLTDDKFRREFKIQKWLDSYYILTDNQTNLTLASAFGNVTDYYSDAFDPGSLVQRLEKKIHEYFSSANKSYELIVNCFDHMNNPTQEFYTRHLTQMHRSQGIEMMGNFNWPLIGCLFLVFVTVYFALWKGIKSAGKAVWITAIAPYIVLFILLVRGFTLRGYEIGMKFYLTVNKWEELTEVKIWIEAATQIFFSLGPGFGTIIALSSYNKKKNNIYKDALLTSFINCFTSILSGCVVFSTLGHMAFEQNKTIHDVAESGPGLIFVAYPQAISTMPYAPFWAVIFFFMLFTLGIDSTFGGLESFITAICDAMPQTFGKRRSSFVLILITICFFASMPTVTYGGPYIVNLFDEFAVAPAILFVAVIEVIGIMYIYGCDRFCNDINEMLGFRPGPFWTVCWLFISPGIVISIIFMICRDLFKNASVMGDYRYDGIGQIISVVVVCGPISFIPIYIFYRFCIENGTFKERFFKVTKLRKRWWAIFDVFIEYVPQGYRKNFQQPAIATPPSSPDLAAGRKKSYEMVISGFNYSPRDPVNL